MNHDFFIGKDTTTGERLVYDGDDLTTHGIIVGGRGRAERPRLDEGA